MTDIRPATPQLLDLAAEMRPDWDADALRGALTSAATNGWSFGKAFLATARLLCDPDAAPRDLLAAVRSPLERPPAPVAEDVVDRGAALARSLLAEKLIAADMARDGDAA